MRGDDTREANFETVRLASKYLGRGVVAVDLAGAEALYPTEDYADVFAYARELGVPFTIHAGEAAGPGSVRAALSFGAKRIGHGLRAVEDGELLSWIASRGITLETCPSSELQTSIIDDYTQFPLKRLLDMGVNVTVNADNMGVSATDVRRELLLLTSLFDLTDQDIHRLLLNAAHAGFAGEALKQELARRIDEAFAG
jgi:adenosine deaminase